MGRRRKLSFLPKVTSPSTFLSPPPSPVRVNSRNLSSAPIVSLVPREVRRKGRGETFESKEPTSPKVSCMGQVKCKNKKKKKKMKKKRPEEQEQHGITMLVPLQRVVIKIFQRKQRGGKSDQESLPGVQRVLSLGHTKRFSSGRGVLQNFDWKAHDVGGRSPPDGPNHCEDGRKYIVEDEAIVVVKPRKHVNLWKRRNMSPPKSLKL